jgi:hypothetical protein
VWGNLDYQVGVQCRGDPVQERDGRYGTVGLEAGLRGLGHAGPGRQLDLRQAQSEAAALLDSSQIGDRTERLITARRTALSDPKPA